jgi:AcrR family transcriptional regulator
MGLREKKKRETEERILRVSRETFMTKGYAETTVDEIAENAGIGVGTLYNYFRSKAEIFIAVMTDEIDMDGEDTVLLESDLEHDAVKIVMDYMWKHFSVAVKMGKKMWKELFFVMMSAGKSDNVLFSGIAKLDYRLIDKLERFLRAMQDRNIFQPDFDAAEASYAVYSVLMIQIMFYVYTDATLEDFIQRIERQIRFIFGGKYNMGKEI